jgi:hypothetical protein
MVVNYVSRLRTLSQGYMQVNAQDIDGTHHSLKLRKCVCLKRGRGMFIHCILDTPQKMFKIFSTYIY